MIFDDRTLPTPLALCLRRLAVADPESAEYFLAASYVAEALTKCVGAALHGALSTKAPEQAYRMAYTLVRSDGLGEWDQWIRACSTQPIAGFIPPTVNELQTWLSAARTPPAPEGLHDAVAHLRQIFELLAVSDTIPDRKPTVRDVLGALVQIRNKTKAHGAVGPNFFAAANRHYWSSIEFLLKTCPLFSWRWIHVSIRENGKIRGIHLQGHSPSHLREAELSGLDGLKAGTYFWPPAASLPLPCSTLLRTDRECTVFFIANGRASQDTAEYLDYGTGRISREDISALGRPPAELPPSETHGLPAIDVQANVFGNLPELSSTYVRRPTLEAELERRLRDRNHPIITLHGRGGIGKTSLALRAAHSLAREKSPPFDCIVWFSARDIDLRASGPKDVKPAVIDLEAMSRQFGALFDREGTVESFARALQSPQGLAQTGILFVCDNFETLEGTTQLHEFLDTHTHLPNKVLITSRERAFKADFPIEVVGMSRDEAVALMRATAASLEIEPMVTPEVEGRIYEYSEGHPYVIRVVLGEMAKEGRYVAPTTLLPRRLDIVDSVFERSFNRLTEAGRRVFLTVAAWKSAVSELALLVVLGERRIDVEAGIEECIRLSLLERREFQDSQPAYVAPQLARLFGQKKLQGDADRLVIQEDLQLLQRFGVVPVGQPITIPQDAAVERFLAWALQSSQEGTAPDAGRLDRIVEALAELWPAGWLSLARSRVGRASPEAVAYAFRRAVEEMPSSREAHLERAAFARTQGDEATFIASRLRAVELSPSDMYLLRDVAFDVVKYVTEHASEIPPQRRSVYVANLRDMLREHVDRLDATGLSRLAWLYFLEGSKREAWDFASAGLKKEPDNKHCFNIIKRLRQDGFESD